MRAQRTSQRSRRLRSERGVSMVEYTILIARIALALIGILSFFGLSVSHHLGVGGPSIECGDYAAGDCPSGNWDLAHIDSPEAAEKKKHQRQPERRQLRLCQERHQRQRQHQPNLQRQRQRHRTRRQRVVNRTAGTTP